MYSYLVCQLFLVVVTVKAIVSHPMGDGMAFTRLNKTYEEKLRLELIKQNILRGLHIRNREVEKEKETSHDKSYFDRKLKTSAIHKALANSRPGSVTAIILADHGKSYILFSRHIPVNKIFLKCFLNIQVKNG